MTEDAEVTDRVDAETDAERDGAEESDADPAETFEGEAATDPESASGESTPDAADVADRVAEHDEELADEVADLASRVEELEADLAAAERELSDRQDRVEELESNLKRKQADFQNYKKRTKRKQEQLKERATEEFVERVVSVRDNLVRALDQDEGTDIREGVESTLEEFDRVLDEENVSPIEPSAGEEVDPQRHEVMMRVDSDQPGGTVVDLYRPGYEMADSVIRPAQVTVSDDE